MPYGAEISLALLLSRVKPSDKDLAEAAAVVCRGIDWKRFCSISAAHGVSPLIYKNISLLEGVPPEVVERFKGACLFSIGDSARAARELRDIVETLEKEGVAAVAIKGILTADEVFGDASLYPSSDIDILIRKADATRACEIMKTKGYGLESGEETFPSGDYEELHFFRKGAKGVDFHFGLGKRRYFSVPEEFWWEDSRERHFEGRIYRVLPVEKNLLFSGLHLFDHGYAPLKFIVAMAEMLRVFKKDIRWEKLIGEARNFDALKPLLLSLYLASTLLGAPLPADVCEMLEGLPARERRIFRRIGGLVFDEGARLSHVMLLLTFLQYGKMQVAQRMLKWIFPPLGEISLRYDLPRHSKKVYFYYVANPVLLLLKRRQL